MRSILTRRAATWLEHVRIETAWVDPVGLRRLIRSHFAYLVAALSSCAMLGAVLLRLGNPTLFAILCGLVAGEVLVAVVLERRGQPLSSDRLFRLVLMSWLVGFGLLGAAGWALDGTEYHGEVVTLVSIMAAGLVALVEPFPIALVWAFGSTLAVLLGASITGSMSGDAVIPAGAILIGAFFAGRLRDIVETYLGGRRALIHEITAIPIGPDPFVTGRAILAPLVEHATLHSASFVWFSDAGHSIMLASGGIPLPAALEPGMVFPDNRNEYLRSRADSGPWISGWVPREVDTPYGEAFARLGVDAVAYVPLHHRGRLIGLLAAAVGTMAGGPAALAEKLPILVEVAEIAGPALGPGLLELEARSAAGKLLRTVLDEHQYWPVFQPICELAGGAIVGYEALTRFRSPVSTAELFASAARLERLDELELATLQVALEESATLPAECWLSVNVSAALLAETESLRALLLGLPRRIVLELSERDEIHDYGPLTTALARLGPDRTLAVDDAGAGFASLRHILEIHPAFVKLDLALVQGVATDMTRRAAVAGFVHFARDAGFTLIAEGIETSEDLAVLRSLGVELGQGYLLGIPEPVQPDRRRDADPVGLVSAAP